jgi:hypothetical protein
MFNERNEILDAILEEAKDTGLPPAFIALIKKMNEDQKELIRCLDDEINGKQWMFKRVEDRINKLEEKVDPEAAEKRKHAPQNESLAACRLPKPL